MIVEHSRAVVDSHTAERERDGGNRLHDVVRRPVEWQLIEPAIRLEWAAGTRRLVEPLDRRSHDLARIAPVRRQVGKVVE